MKVYTWRTLFVICWVVSALCTSFCSKQLTAQVNENFCDHQSDGISTKSELTFLNIEPGKSTATDLILEYGEPRHMGSYNVKGVDIVSYQYILENAGEVYFTVVDNVL